MLILALDTTTRTGSVAIARDDEVLVVIEGDPTRTHGERMPGEIQQALAQAGLSLDAVNLFAVASGPGAFTGLRIGLATIQGLAMVTSTPVIGVSALQALAEAAWTDLGNPAHIPVAAWMDAQRGEVFSAAYSWPSTETQSPSVGLPDHMADVLETVLPREALFIGDGAARYAGLIARRSAGRWTVASSVPLLGPSLTRIARRLAERGEAGPPHALRPLYVRRPDAEIARDG